MFTIVVIGMSFLSFFNNTYPVSEYIKHSKKEYAKEISQGSQKTIHFVVGNESADMDSVACSIVYAYLLQDQSKGKEIVLPLINIPSSDISLREDIVILLSALKIDLKDLIFIDENPPLEFLQEGGKLKFSLVDHNLLNRKLHDFSPSVVNIIDHHADEKVDYPQLNPDDKLITKVGSSATLVAEKMFLEFKQTPSKDLALLLLAPILIDTQNLTSQEKTTDKDIGMVAMLKDVLSGSLPENFYEILWDAKNNVSTLSPEEILNKDYKGYLEKKCLYGISSIPKSVDWWIRDEVLLFPVMKEFSASRGLSYYFLLLHHHDEGGAKRKLIIYSADNELRLALDTYFKEDPVLKELLEPIETNSKLQYFICTREVSRKQLQPILKLKK